MEQHFHAVRGKPPGQQRREIRQLPCPVVARQDCYGQRARDSKRQRSLHRFNERSKFFRRFAFDPHREPPRTELDVAHFACEQGHKGFLRGSCGETASAFGTATDFFDDGVEVQMTLSAFGCNLDLTRTKWHFYNKSILAKKNVSPK